jgi:hypothetical protein
LLRKIGADEYYLIAGKYRNGFGYGTGPSGFYEWVAHTHPTIPEVKALVASVEDQQLLRLFQIRQAERNLPVQLNSRIIQENGVAFRFDINTNFIP